MQSITQEQTELRFTGARAGGGGIVRAEGPSGSSAYELWLAQGHSGTPADYQNWLRAVTEVDRPLAYYPDEQRLAIEGAYLPVTVQNEAEQVSVSWSYRAVDEFLVLRSAGNPPGGPYEEVATLPGTATGYTDTDVEVGTTYRYRVLARGLPTGEGEALNALSVDRVFDLRSELGYVYADRAGTNLVTPLGARRVRRWESFHDRAQHLELAGDRLYDEPHYNWYNRFLYWENKQTYFPFPAGAISADSFAIIAAVRYVAKDHKQYLIGSASSPNRCYMGCQSNEDFFWQVGDGALVTGPELKETWVLQGINKRPDSVDFLLAAPGEATFTTVSQANSASGGFSSLNLGSYAGFASFFESDLHALLITDAALSEDDLSVVLEAMR